MKKENIYLNRIIYYQNLLNDLNNNEQMSENYEYVHLQRKKYKNLIKYKQAGGKLNENDILKNTEKITNETLYNFSVLMKKYYDDTKNTNFYIPYIIKSKGILNKKINMTLIINDLKKNIEKFEIDMGHTYTSNKYVSFTLLLNIFKNIQEIGKSLSIIETNKNTGDNNTSNETNETNEQNGGFFRWGETAATKKNREEIEKQKKILNKKKLAIKLAMKEKFKHFIDDSVNIVDKENIANTLCDIYDFICEENKMNTIIESKFDVQNLFNFFDNKLHGHNNESNNNGFFICFNDQSENTQSETLSETSTDNPKKNENLKIYSKLSDAHNDKNYLFVKFN